MQMLISRDRLRRRIAEDADMEVEAGIPLLLIEDLGAFISPELVHTECERPLELQSAFGRLITQLRRRDGLTPEDLALKADVDLAEIQLIERDLHYKPRPRTVHRIAQVFRLNVPSLMRLAGVAHAADLGLKNAALRFAARSDASITRLNDEEHKALNDFVKALDESAG